MTPEEFSQYLDSLPPEVRAGVCEVLKPIGEYTARAMEVRAWVAKQFPAINPPLRAALSLALARFR